MSFSMRLSEQAEVAGSVAVNVEWARRPQYGRYLDEFVPGQVFVHPRGYTFERGPMLDFARVFMQCNPLYLNVEYAKAHGFPDLPASPQMVFNVVVAGRAQRLREGDRQSRLLQRAIPAAGLSGRHPARLYQGGGSQGARRGQAGHRADSHPGREPAQSGGVAIRAQDHGRLSRRPPADHAGADHAGRIPVGRASGGGSADQRGRLSQWVDRPQHLFRGFLARRSDRPCQRPHHHRRAHVLDLSGRQHPSVAFRSGVQHRPVGQDERRADCVRRLVFAWLEGLASRDVSENALWELGFTEGYHTQPAVSGDTVAALSRVVATETLPNNDAAGIVTFQFIGVKNISAADALETHGADLFIKENDKQKLSKEKISSKIFEIERRLLIKRRPA
jgi:2-methylfumaryl-CoA hydratase